MEQKEIHALSSYNRNEKDKWRTHSRYQQHESCHITLKPQARGGYKKDGEQTCHYCGYSSTHPTCPDRSQEWRNRHKTNHLARVCNFKPVRQICFTHSSVFPSTSRGDSIFMIIAPTSTKTPKVTALINDSPVTFGLDTGASVNIISGRVYNGFKNTDQPYTARQLDYLPTDPNRRYLSEDLLISRCNSGENAAEPRYSWMTMKTPYLDSRICLVPTPPKH